MTATDAVRITTMRHRCAFILLGSVQAKLIFTLAMPLPHIGREFDLDRADLILLSSAYGLTFAGAAGLAAKGVGRGQTGLAGGVLNTAMEVGPTVLLTLAERCHVIGRHGSRARRRPLHPIIHRSRESLK